MHPLRKLGVHFLRRGGRSPEIPFCILGFAFCINLLLSSYNTPQPAHPWNRAGQDGATDAHCALSRLARRTLWKKHLSTRRTARVLDSLSEFLEREKIDLLLVAGDVFDTNNPGADAETARLSVFSQARGEEDSRRGHRRQS